MTTQKSDIERLLLALSNRILNTSEVSDILNNPRDFPSILIEELSIETALKYWKRQITYEEADCIVNNLYSFWVTNDYFVKIYEFSDISWKIFEAFDSGEYYRDSDDKRIRPDEKYTRPLIEDLLTKNKLIV